MTLPVIFTDVRLINMETLGGQPLKTMTKLLARCTERKHQLLGVSNVHGISTGQLRIHCNSCDCEFTTSFNSYNAARKTGCPNCKSLKVQQQWQGVERSTPEAKQQTKKACRARRSHTGEHPFIKNKEDLLNHLKNENNEYSLFMLDKMASPTLVGTIERHHIIPIHDKGPNEPWNLVALSPAEHVQAHLLRGRAYGQAGDNCMVGVRSMESPQSEDIRLARIRASHETCKQKKLGFYDPEIQRKNGQKNGKTQTPLKVAKYTEKQNDKVQGWLQQGSTWVVEGTLQRIVLQPGQAALVNQVSRELVNALPIGELKTSLNKKIRRKSQLF